MKQNKTNCKPKICFETALWEVLTTDIKSWELKMSSIIGNNHRLVHVIILQALWNSVHCWLVNCLQNVPNNELPKVDILKSKIGIGQMRIFYPVDCDLEVHCFVGAAVHVKLNYFYRVLKRLQEKEKKVSGIAEKETLEMISVAEKVGI